MNKKMLVFLAMAVFVVAMFLTGCRMTVATSDTSASTPKESQPAEAELVENEYKILMVNRYKGSGYGGFVISGRTYYDLILQNANGDLREYSLLNPAIELGVEDKLVVIWGEEKPLTPGQNTFVLVLTEETIAKLTGPL